MRLELSFVHPAHGTRTVGALDGFRIDREAVRAGPGDEVLARHVREQWEVENVKYFRLQCNARYTVRFEGAGKPPSRRFGPFSSLTVMGGLAYTGDKVFALMDARLGAWLCYDLGVHYPVMAVTAA